MPSRIEKLNSLAELESIDVFLITSAPSVKYFSGYFFYFEYGPSPFHMLPSTLVVAPGKTTTLLVADNELQQCSNVDSSVSISPYQSYVYQTPLEFTRQFLVLLDNVIKENSINTKRIGIEANFLPFAIADSLRTNHPNIEFVDVTAQIGLLRAVKDSDEIEFIRAACR